VHLTLAVCDTTTPRRHVRRGAHGRDYAQPLVFDTIGRSRFVSQELEWDVSELSFGKYMR